MLDHNTEIISIDLIKPDPNQPRKSFDDITELAENIRTQGLIHAIEVDENYMIIVGERRYRAILSLGWQEIPVRVNKYPLTPYARLVRQMSENLHQSSARTGDAMSPIETAEAWAKLYKLKTGKRLKTELFDFSTGNVTQLNGPMLDIINEVGAKKNTVYRLLQLLNEPQFVKKAIHSKKIPYSYIEELGKAPEAAQPILRKKLVQGAYHSSRQIREDIQVADRLPELALIHRDRIKESNDANRILNGVTRLGLALDAIPLTDVSKKEQGVVKSQLHWIQEMIDKYLVEDITP